MKKRKKNIYWIFLIIIIIVFGILISVFLNNKKIPETCPNLTSYEQYKVSPKTVPVVQGNGKKCPNSNYAKEKWIREFIGPDSGWSKFVYCEEDKIFWIAVQAGLVPADEYGSMVYYYGPFKGEPCFIEKY